MCAVLHVHRDSGRSASEASDLYAVVEDRTGHISKSAACNHCYLRCHTAAGFPPCWSMQPSQFHVSKCSGSAGGGRSSHRTRLPGRVIAAPTRLYAQQGKRARVYRNDDRVSNDQRVHGRRPHGRRSVDEDDIEVGQDRCPAQEKLAIDLFLPPGGRRPRYQWSSAGVSNEDESQRGTGQCRASR